MAVRALARLVGGGPVAPFVAGTLLSLVAFAAALTYVWIFARDIVGDERADVALWLLAFYPFAFFYGAIYTESLFLLSAAGAFVHFRRGDHTIAALWGVITGLTRPNGLLIAVPLAIQALVPLRARRGVRDDDRDLARADDRDRVRDDDRGRRFTGGAILAVAAPVLGALIYSCFLWIRTGDPLIWARGHVAWGRNYQGLGALVTDRYRMIANGGLGAYLAALPHDAMNALGALFVFATAWPVARRIGPEYALWMLLNILPPLAAGGLISIGRFSSVLFPAFVWMASAVPSRHRPAWIGAFAALQALFAAMFYTWRPLY